MSQSLVGVKASQIILNETQLLGTDFNFLSWVSKNSFITEHFENYMLIATQS